MSHVKAQHVDDPVKNKLLRGYLRSSFPEGSCDGSSTREEGKSLSVRLTRSHQNHPMVPGLHQPDQQPPKKLDGGCVNVLAVPAVLECTLYRRPGNRTRGQLEVVSRSGSR